MRAKSSRYVYFILYLTGMPSYITMYITTSFWLTTIIESWNYSQILFWSLRSAYDHAHFILQLSLSKHGGHNANSSIIKQTLSSEVTVCKGWLLPERGSKSQFLTKWKVVNCSHNRGLLQMPINAGQLLSSQNVITWWGGGSCWNFKLTFYSACCMEPHTIT